MEANWRIEFCSTLVAILQHICYLQLILSAKLACPDPARFIDMIVYTPDCALDTGSRRIEFTPRSIPGCPVGKGCPLNVHEYSPFPGIGLASRLSVERLKVSPSLTVYDGSMSYVGGAD